VICRVGRVGGFRRGFPPGNSRQPARDKVVERLVLVFQAEYPLQNIPIHSPNRRRLKVMFDTPGPVDGVGILDAAAATLDRESYVHLVMHAWAHPGEDSQRWGRISEVCREKAPRPFSVPLRVTGRDHAPGRLIAFPGIALHDLGKIVAHRIGQPVCLRTREEMQGGVRIC
jgi:hypothetical protein